MKPSLFLPAILIVLVVLSAAPASAQVELTCTPGTSVLIEGRAAPSTALLLKFGGRNVGGGMSGRDGRYKLRLDVGREKPGAYAVSVEVRETREVVQRFRCIVPGSSAPVSNPANSTPHPTNTSPPANVATPIPTLGPECEQSYPDFCIPSGLDDVNCGDDIISGRQNFRVLPPDPYRLDGGGTPGIGCEG